MLIGCFLSGIFLSAIALVYTSPVAVMTCAVIGRFFTGFSNATFAVLFSDTIVYATWKTGKNAAGWIMGLMNQPVKIGVFLRGIIITAALASIGYSAKLTPAQFTPALKQGLSYTFGLIPGISLLAAGLIILVAFKLTKSKVAQYQAEIDKRA
jgi:GPH family glycoside/pentoside/hexuronide:cation symporter